MAVCEKCKFFAKVNIKNGILKGYDASTCLKKGRCREAEKETEQILKEIENTRQRLDREIYFCYMRLTVFVRDYL